MTEKLKTQRWYFNCILPFLFWVTYQSSKAQWTQCVFYFTYQRTSSDKHVFLLRVYFLLSREKLKTKTYIYGDLLFVLLSFCFLTMCCNVSQCGWWIILWQKRRADTYINMYVFSWQKRYEYACIFEHINTYFVAPPQEFFCKDSNPSSRSDAALFAINWLTSPCSASAYQPHPCSNYACSYSSKQQLCLQL